MIAKPPVPRPASMSLFDLNVRRFDANVAGDDSRRARHLALNPTHSRVVVAARALRARRGQGPECQQTDAVTEGLSRKKQAAMTPGIRAVRLLQSSRERAHRPAVAPDADGTQSREALLQACASGDRTALHSLYRGTAAQLFGLALRLLRRRDLAEEIVQDSFLLVWRNAHAFDPRRGAAMAWLARIVRNRCIDVLRQRGREAPLDDAFIEDWEDPVSSPADLAELSQDARRLEDCLDELREYPRKVLRLVYYEGLTYREAAVRMGVPLGTVKSWVRHSLVRLRGCMER